MHAATHVYATATLLKNGKVLIAGGTDGPWGISESIYASAEIYDPATSTFSKTGSMKMARAEQTATLLDDGRVLMTGGYGCLLPRACVKQSSFDILASAELYDPTTGKFTLTGSMAAPRTHASATLLVDGRVLVTSGDTTNRMGELYDPSSGRFTETGKDAIDYSISPAVLLPNGKVLEAAGGAGDPLVGSLYDPATGKFTKISLEPAPNSTPSAQVSGGQVVERYWPSSGTVLKDGRVLLFEGGYLETYDPSTGACADIGFMMPTGLQAPTATSSMAIWLSPTVTLLPNGWVLFIGGQFGPFTATATSAVLYDPASGSEILGPLKTARSDQTATLLANGSVLVAGGDDTNKKALASAELFQP
jgi:hypothetical protein